MGDFDISSLFGNLGGLFGGGGGAGGGGGLGDLLGGGGGGGLGSLLGGAGGGGLGGLLGGLDPLSGIADGVANMLNQMGVPKEITDAGKIVGGCYCGDPGLIVDGACGEVGDLSKDMQNAQQAKQQATTEMPPEEPESCGDGYCDDDNAASGAGQGTNVDVDVNGTGGSTDVDVDVGSQASTASDPDSDDDGATTSSMNLDSPDVLNWIPSDPQEAASYGAWRSEYDMSNQNGFMGREDFLSALKTSLIGDPGLRAAFEKDFGCQISPNVPGGHDELVVSKPEHHHHHHESQPVDGDDGGGAGAPSTDPNVNVGVTTNGSGSTDVNVDINNIMNSSMSVEDKVEMILDQCMDNLDSQIDSKMSQLEQASQKAGNDSKSGTDVQQLQQQLQDLIQMRQEMYSTNSNISKDFHDMGMTAINNMKG